MNFRNLARVTLLVLLFGCLPVVPAAPRLRVASFRASATPEAGDPLIWVTPAEKIEDPLWAKGVVIEDGKTRVVLCAIDWCGIGGAADLLLRTRIAEAAAMRVAQVALQSVHQHTAPYIDGDGYRILTKLHSPPLMMSAASLERLAGRMAAAVRQAMHRLEPFDEVGTGEAAVEQVALARRIFTEGKLVTRYSTGGSDPRLAALPDGDPIPLPAP
jgi:hypothetical protein